MSLHWKGEPMRIGYIVGSLSTQSLNRRLLKALLEVFGDRADYVELPIADLPVYNRDLDSDFPPAATEFKRLLGEIDGLVIATPEYNRSIPASLKNALDWGSRPAGDNSFPGIPVGILGASAGRLGTAVSQQQLRAVLGYLDMPTLGQPEFFYTFDEADFDRETGAAANDRLRGRLEKWAGRFIAHVERNPRS